MNTNELKLKVTDIVLKHLKLKNSTKFRVAGGAPRDWYFGREVNDIDVYTNDFSWNFDSALLKSLLAHAGIDCFNICSRNKTPTNTLTKSSTGKYGSGGGGTMNINKHIVRVDELCLTLTRGTLDICFDIIQLDTEPTFENIWKTYDLDICMIGYEDGKLSLSKIFRDRYGNGKVPSYAEQNARIDIRLLHYSNANHFPKLQKKYPELTRSLSGSLWGDVDFKVSSTIPMPIFTKGQIIPGTSQDKVPALIEQPCTNHEWTAIQLIFSSVWDCKHCGIKKEDYKEELEFKAPF